MKNDDLFVVFMILLMILSLIIFLTGVVWIIFTDAVLHSTASDTLILNCVRTSIKAVTKGGMYYVTDSSCLLG